MTQADAADTTPIGQLRLAAIWLQRGKLTHAIDLLRAVIQTAPTLAGAYVLLGNALRQQERFAEAETIFAQGLAVEPNLTELHKGYIECMETRQGLDTAYDRFALSRVDPRPIDCPPGAVLGCAVVRNERLRLPFFLSYYRGLGVSRFFMVDNGSTDGTVDFLASQHDVYLWHSLLSFNQANFGSAWFELLLRRYGRDQWWVMADADELLVYPGCETLLLPQACRNLARHGKRALPAILVDMYSDRPVAETAYAAGMDFRAVCPYFDRQTYHRRYTTSGPYHNLTIYEGGARERLLGPRGGYLQTKVPLLRYDTDCLLSGGQHLTNLPASTIAEAQGAVLHFKYFATFPEYVRQEISRGEHYGAAMQYREYSRLLDADQSTLYDPACSVRLEDSRQLEQLGILQRGELLAPPPGHRCDEPVQPQLHTLTQPAAGVYPRPDEDNHG